MMQRAVALAQQGMDGNHGGPFGAVIADGTKVVGQGFNRVLETNDPTAHAEVLAIRDACQSLNSFSLQGLTLYSSCEPCPMCLAAAYWARLDAVYFANTRSDAARIGFDDAAIYAEVKRAPELRKELPTIHFPCPTAATAFENWQAKADRTDY